MNRKLVVTLLLVLFVLTSLGGAQRRRNPRPAPDGKTDVKCPGSLNDITDCMTLNPDTGCGHLDVNLNKQKNIRSDDRSPSQKELQDIKNLPDPVAGFKIGDPRDGLKEIGAGGLGEGDKVTVVAYALVARSGSSESCNCNLTRAADTDNHIVLVDEAALDQFPAFVPGKHSALTVKQIAARKLKVLHDRERDSITAEFVPRVRLDHPDLKGSRLQALIKTAPRDALKVMITGLVMFDSEHSFKPLPNGRHNNWEVHPVLGLKYCPIDKTCPNRSSSNWKDLEQ